MDYSFVRVLVFPSSLPIERSGPGTTRTGTRFFSAHGITALLRTQRAATCAQVTLTLREAAPCVTYLLAATGTRTNLGAPATGASR
ncbi:hypothetical protein V6U89_18865 [Micromonospora sp. CPCC 206171]|uniref:hypothetical protein n=1 Tax=Micromonospora sp. CPCC 206171 TaxID=3122405 RepID=UPI002FF02DFC